MRSAAATTTTLLRRSDVVVVVVGVGGCRPWTRLSTSFRSVRGVWSLFEPREKRRAKEPGRTPRGIAKFGLLPLASCKQTPRLALSAGPRRALPSRLAEASSAGFRGRGGRQQRRQGREVGSPPLAREREPAPPASRGRAPAISAWPSSQRNDDSTGPSSDAPAVIPGPRLFTTAPTPNPVRPKIHLRSLRLRSMRLYLDELYALCSAHNLVAGGSYHT
jgi:hypothetical protein